MILGFVSIALDLIFLNFYNYEIGNILFFPMFSLVYLISSIYFKIDLKKVFIIYIFYSLITGIIFLPLFIIFINYIYKLKNNNYLLTIFLSISLYDLIFFLFMHLSNINLLIDKYIITIPINIIYSLFIFYVLNKKNNKYKLV